MLRTAGLGSDFPLAFGDADDTDSVRRASFSSEGFSELAPQTPYYERTRKPQAHVVKMYTFLTWVLVKGSDFSPRFKEQFCSSGRSQIPQQNVTERRLSIYLNDSWGFHISRHQIPSGSVLQIKLFFFFLHCSRASAGTPLCMTPTRKK